jgi:hypothetical protein
MKKILWIVPALIANFLVSSLAVSGGTSGGGSPPAMKDLQEMLMSNPELNAGLFDRGDGEIGLGLRGSLEPKLRVLKTNVQSDTITLTDIDFDLLSKNKTVDAKNLSNLSSADSELSRSYAIQDGDSLGELVLKDRRQISRESVK